MKGNPCSTPAGRATRRASSCAASSGMSVGCAGRRISTGESSVTDPPFGWRPDGRTGTHGSGWWATSACEPVPGSTDTRSTHRDNPVPLASPMAPERLIGGQSRMWHTARASNLMKGIVWVRIARMDRSEEIVRQPESSSDSREVAFPNVVALAVTLQRIGLRTAVDVRVVEHPFAALRPVHKYLEPWIMLAQFPDEFPVRIRLSHRTSKNRSFGQQSRGRGEAAGPRRRTRSDPWSRPWRAP